MTESFPLFRADVPEGVCSSCLAESTGMLEFEMVIDGQYVKARVCRACLSEHCPEALAAIEEDAMRGLSIDGGGEFPGQT